MTAEARTKIVDEVKRFAADLNLSESQKSQLQTAYERAEDRIEEIRKANPDVTRADVIKKLVAARDQIREHIVKFLTPDQLKKVGCRDVEGQKLPGPPDASVRTAGLPLSTFGRYGEHLLDLAVIVP